MCFGRYGAEENKPLLTATLMVPSVNAGQEIEFLIDTGADGTVIGGPDAIRLGLTPEDVGDEINLTEEKSHGIGGPTKTFAVEEPALFAVEEFSEELEKYSLHIEFIDKLDIIPRCHRSLLGRDILDRFDVAFRQSQGEVELIRHNYGDGAYMCMGLEEEGIPTLLDQYNGDNEDEDSPTHE